MASYGAIAMPPSDAALSRKVSIVGIGETDYDIDYQNERKRPEGWEPPTEETLLVSEDNPGARALYDARGDYVRGVKMPAAIGEAFRRG